MINIKEKKLIKNLGKTRRKERWNIRRMGVKPPFFINNY
jgi:hypothetical protein